MNEGETRTVNIGRVERPDPPIRGEFNTQELARLTASIKEHGILVPLLVRKRGDQFEVIDGDRRLAAAWNAGLREIPVVVRSLDDKQTHIQRMLANKDREDTDPVSEAKYIARTVAEKIITIDEWCEKMGRTSAWVSDRLTIAEMPVYMQNALTDKAIPLGVCLELHQIKDEDTKHRYFKEALRNGMTIHSAHINRVTVNEAIEALEGQGEEVTPERVPEVQTIPKVQCALTGETLLVTQTRMVRVGIENYDRWIRTRDLPPSPTG